MSVEEYVVVRNAQNKMAAYKVEARERGRLFLTRRVEKEIEGRIVLTDERKFISRYNSHGNITFPKPEFKREGVPEQGAIVFTEKPTYLGNPGRIDASDTLIKQVIQGVLIKDRESQERRMRYVTQQKHQREEALNFLRERFYCFRQE